MNPVGGTNVKVRKILAIAIVVLLPLAVGTVYLGALAGRAASPENIKAAVVNLDEMVTMDISGNKQPMLGGRLVAAQLAAPPDGSQVQLTWTQTNEAEASRGLRDGEFYAVVTIPKDFSKKIAAALQTSEGAVPADVQVQANTQASPLAAKYGEQDARYAAAQVSSQLTEQYLAGVFKGIAQMGEQTKTAVDGATKLADGSQKLASGVGETSKGASQLADGSKQLADGVAKSADGASQLSQGIGQLASGAGQFQQGTSQLSSGAGQLATGAAKLSEGITAYTGGVSGAADGVKAMAKQSGSLTEGTKQLAKGADGVSKLAAATGAQTSQGLKDAISAGKSLGAAAEPLQQAGATLQGKLAKDLTQAGNSGGTMAGALAAIAGMCQSGAVTDAAVCAKAADGAQAAGQFQAQMGAVQGDLTSVGGDLKKAGQTLSTAGGQVKDAATAIGTANAIVNGPTSKQLPVTLHAAAEKLADGTAMLAEQTPVLVKGITDLNSGMKQLKKSGAPLAKATSQLSEGISQLSSGASMLSSNTGKLVTGITQLNSGASALAGGMGQLKTGADGLASGTKQLADGTGQLKTGAEGVASGNKQFADQLGKSTGQLPGYSVTQASDIANVITTPVTATVKASAPRSDDGASSAAIIPIALWLGALGIFLLLRALPRGVAYSAAGPLRLTIAGYLPGAGLIAAAAVLLVALLPAAGMKMSNWLAVALLSLLGGLVFAALNQAARALWGRIGSLVSLAFFALQFACIGGVMPASSAPAFFRALAPILPMSELSAALAGPILGTPAAGSGMQVAAMVLWGLVGAGATAWVVRRTQGRAAMAVTPLAPASV